jgi:hypothetical protein
VEDKKKGSNPVSGQTNGIPAVEVQNPNLFRSSSVSKIDQSSKGPGNNILLCTGFYVCRFISYQTLVNRQYHNNHYNTQTILTFRGGGKKKNRKFI